MRRLNQFIAIIDEKRIPAYPGENGITNDHGIMQHIIAGIRDREMLNILLTNSNNKVVFINPRTKKDLRYVANE